MCYKYDQVWTYLDSPNKLYADYINSYHLMLVLRYCSVQQGSFYNECHIYFLQNKSPHNFLLYKRFLFIKKLIYDTATALHIHRTSRYSIKILRNLLILINKSSINDGIKTSCQEISYFVNFILLLLFSLY